MASTSMHTCTISCVLCFPALTPTAPSFGTSSRTHREPRQTTNNKQTQKVTNTRMLGRRRYNNIRHRALRHEVECSRVLYCPSLPRPIAPSIHRSIGPVLCSPSAPVATIPVPCDPVV